VPNDGKTASHRNEERGKGWLSQRNEGEYLVLYHGESKDDLGVWGQG